jgi:hypothetical protein
LLSNKFLAAFAIQSHPEEHIQDPASPAQSCSGATVFALSQTRLFSAESLRDGITILRDKLQPLQPIYELKQIHSIAIELRIDPVLHIYDSIQNAASD